MNPQSNLHQKKVMGTVWWSAASLIPYSFLNPCETITSGKYAQESMRCTENYNTYSQQWSTERALFFSMTTSNHTSHNQNFKSWMPKNWCFWTVVSEKTLESLLDCKEIKPVHPKGNQSWIFIGRTDTEAEAPILWPPDAKNWLIWKDPDAGKDWRREEKAVAEEEMVGWHHQLHGHEFEQALGVGDGQGSLAHCSPWDRKESDTTEILNWTENILKCFWERLL